VTALVASVFVASLLGSAHCAGMCGGFVCAYAPGATRWSHVAYHGARLLTYVGLGALAGIVGAGVTQAGALLALQNAAALVAGLLMVLWGTATVLAARGVAVPQLAWPAGPQRWMQRLVRRAAAWSPTQRALTLGAITTLLPCGWLYAFVVTAAGTGAPLSAMLVMSVFWLGTVPALLAVAVGVRRLSASWRQRLPILTASSVVIIGLLTIALHVWPRDHAAHAATLESPTHDAHQH
jgi:sulfite exporter TauE/SafE